MKQSGSMSSGSQYHHDTRDLYPQQTADMGDNDLLHNMNEYDTNKGMRDLLVRRQDHRVWRRVLIAEALRRGLISKDPGGAP